MLGVGPQGLGGDSTAFAVHVETAATHITMNPVAVNMQCHSARRARATFSANGSRIWLLGCSCSSFSPSFSPGLAAPRGPPKWPG